MKVHFIAIGGSAMHNLALALHKEGHAVSGSDDEIFEPSRSRLEQAGILPDSHGWFPEKISKRLDAVILGMHAHADNPELAKAREIGVPVFSYPGFLYERTKEKKRVVIGGSHGKTTITSMILHVLKSADLEFDYLVGALIEGFENSVYIGETTSFAVFEGDEYLSSTLEPVPKFHLYHPHLALISGVAWDHMNVFPTYENYLEQFTLFIDCIQPGGCLVYCIEDEEVRKLVEAHPRFARKEIRFIPYATPEHRIEDGKTFLTSGSGEVRLEIFGKHNLQNLEGARAICKELDVSDRTFYQAISGFKGASRRLEKLHESGDYIVYRDFAHAPSKLKATAAAVREQHPEYRLIACMELHTYSSLNKDFLDQYRGSMDAPDAACIYFSPKVVEQKRLKTLTTEDVKAAFGRMDLEVVTDNAGVQNFIDRADKQKTVLLLMSSGNWGGGIQWE